MKCHLLRLVGVVLLSMLFLSSAHAIEINIPAALQSEQGQTLLKQLPGYPGAAEGKPFQYWQYIPENISIPKLGVIVVVHGTVGYQIDGNGNIIYDPETDLVALTEHATDTAFTMVKYWKQVAEEKGFMVIAPAYDLENFAGAADPYQYPGSHAFAGYRGIFGRHFDGVDPRSTDADGVLNQVLDLYQANYPGFFEEQIYLTGHSAGGQFVSRYIYLHPERIHSAVVGSAGFVPFPDDSITWPNGTGACDLELWWYPGQTHRMVDIEPAANAAEVIAQKRITLLSGEFETHANVLHDTMHKTKQFHYDLRKDLLNDPVEGVQVKIVDGYGHSGAHLAAATMDSLLPSRRAVWDPSGGMSSSSANNPIYHFTLSESTRVRLDLESDADTYLYLLDENYNTIIEDDNSGNGTNAKIIQNLAPGTYYVVAATTQTGVTAQFDLFANIPVNKSHHIAPTINGYRLDWCYGTSEGCGIPLITDEWCQRTQNAERSSYWVLDQDVGQTYIIGIDQIYTGVGDSFRDVECGNRSQLRESTLAHAPYLTGSTSQVDGSTLTITGTAADFDGDLSSVHLVVMGSTNPTDIKSFDVTATVDCSGTTSWSCSFTAEQDLVYTFYVYPKDQSGLVGAPSETTKRFLGTSCISFTNTVADHETAGRAYSESVCTGFAFGGSCFMGEWVTTWYATGSGEDLGTDSAANVTLYENGTNNYSTTGNCTAPSAPVIGTVSTQQVDNNITWTVPVSDADGDILSVTMSYAGNTIDCLNDHGSTTNWSCHLGALPSGSGQVVITVTDLTGLTDSETLDFTVEGPAAPVVTITDSVIDGDTLIITGTATDANNDLSQVLVGMPAQTGSACSLNGDDFTCNWDITGAQPGQTITVEVAAVDSTSLWSNVVTVEETIEIQYGPTIDSIGNPVVNATAVTISGTASDQNNDIVSVVMTGLTMPLTCDGTESFSCNASGLAPGTYTVYITVTDAYENQAVSDALVFVIEEATCTEYTATASQHETAGRATSEEECTGTLYGTYCFGGSWVTTWSAIGSGDNMGTNGSATVTLSEDPEGYYSVGTCPGPDTTAPVITLNGNSPMTITQGYAYTEAGATVIDDTDGDISGQVVITGSVDTNTIGTYYISYNATDAAGNAATEVVRTVNVVEDTGGECVTATNSNHASAGRATLKYNVLYYANGSNDYLGMGTTSTSLEETSSGYWEMVSSCD